MTTTTRHGKDCTHAVASAYMGIDYTVKLPVIIVGGERGTILVAGMHGWYIVRGERSGDFMAHHSEIIPLDCEEGR